MCKWVEWREYIFRFRHFLVYWQGFRIISENLEVFFSSDKLSQPENPIFESELMSLRWVWCYTDLWEIVLSREMLAVWDIAEQWGGSECHGKIWKSNFFVGCEILVGLRTLERGTRNAELLAAGTKRLPAGPPRALAGCCRQPASSFLAIFISRGYTTGCNMHSHWADQQGVAVQRLRRTSWTSWTPAHMVNTWQRQAG